MKFEEVYCYDRDADTVITMFTDRVYFEKKYEKAADSYDILEHQSDDSRFQIKVKRSMPLNVPVPGFAKKVLGGGGMTVIQEDIWDKSTRRGRINIELVGAPVQITAEMELKQGANGAENHVHWSIDSSIPLIGGKVAKLVAEDIKAKSPEDQKLTNQLLAQY